MTVRATVRSIPCATAAVVLATLLTSAPAGAAVLCGTKDRITGQLRDGASLHVRSVCRTNEVQADLASLGLSAQPHLTVRLGNTITTNIALSSSSACDPGEVATGGGAVASGASGGEAVLRMSRPDPDGEGGVPTGWRVGVANANAPTGTITSTTYTVCAAP